MNVYKLIKIFLLSMSFLLEYFPNGYDLSDSHVVLLFLPLLVDVANSEFFVEDGVDVGAPVQVNGPHPKTSLIYFYF